MKTLNQFPVAEAMRDYAEAVGTFYSGRPKTRKGLRRLYELARLVCVAYVAPDNWTSPTPREPFPKELAGIVERTCGWLMIGRVPVTIADVVGPGDPKAPREEWEDQMRVAAYVAACGDGQIPDKRPVDRMRLACGRHRSRIHAWVKELRSLPNCGDFLKGDIAKKGLAAAERLRRHGRSSQAVAERGKAPRKRAQVSRGR